MDLNLQGKVALIVASSQGLGKAIATQLVKEGSHVMLNSRKEEKLKKVRKELEQLGIGKAAYYSANITNAADIINLSKQRVYHSKKSTSWSIMQEDLPEVHLNNYPMST